MKYLHLYVLPTESAPPLQRADVTTIIFWGGGHALRGEFQAWGEGHALRGGGQDSADLENTEVFSLPPYVSICIYMYIYDLILKRLDSLSLSSEKT